MPELPEVESVVRQLKNRILNKKIKSFTSGINLRRSNLSKIISLQLLEQEIENVSRLGKYILIDFKNNQLGFVVHLGMAGYFILEKDASKQIKHQIFEINFYQDDECLKFFDTRRFGQAFLLPKNELRAFFAKLAPDPFDQFWNNQNFFEKLSKSTTPIKVKLLDQSFISGIGNIYASESLFESKIHPTTPSNKISKDRAAILLAKIKEVLQKSIDLGGSSIRDFKHTNDQDGSAHFHLFVYGKQNVLCKICTTKIEKIVQATRSTFFCPSCQKI